MIIADGRCISESQAVLRSDMSAGALVVLLRIHVLSAMPPTSRLWVA
jgi:hypothetical protein